MKVTTQESVKELYQFLQGIPEVQVMPVIEPEEGLCGFTSWYVKEDQEVSIGLMWREYGPPVSVRVDATTEDVEGWVRAALFDPGWKSCDNPAARKIGIIQFAQDKETILVTFPFTFLKGIPAALSKEFLAWKNLNGLTFTL